MIQLRLSDLQLKEIVNISNGKRMGTIVDVLVNNDGKISEILVEEKRGRKFNHEEYSIKWSQIIKIGDDIILIDTRNK